ncbi:MAG: hypothetical protein ACOX2O_08880 [Bdellovibrionota bacterium]|jgi:hypothetical protein
MEKDIGSDNTFKDGDGATPCLDKSNENEWWLKKEAEENHLSPLKLFFIICLTFLFIAAINIIVADMAVSPWSPIKGVLSNQYLMYPLIMLLVALLFLAMLAIPIGLIMILIGPDRWHGVAIMLSAAMTFMLPMYAMGFVLESPYVACERIAPKSKDLIHAIKTFEVENNAPPPNLEVLVPKYFATLPTPGLAAYNKYEYEVLDQSPYWKGNRWKLSVKLPLLSSEFLYFPEQNYCEIADSPMRQNVKSCGSYLLIGDWAFYSVD